MKIIVGLGNPGREYQNTRHNVGFMTLDKFLILNLKFEINFKFSNFKTEKRFSAEISEGEINGEKIILVRPVTFMNKSGEAVASILNLYKDRVKISEVIVVHDDSDLEIGRIKIQKGGGSAGHHGIESIVKSTGSGDFIRIRVGIRTEKDGKAMDMVLRPFNKDEEKILEEVISRASEAVLFVLTNGVEKAMTKYNIK